MTKSHPTRNINSAEVEKSRSVKGQKRTTLHTADTGTMESNFGHTRKKIPETHVSSFRLGVDYRIWLIRCLSPPSSQLSAIILVIVRAGRLNSHDLLPIFSLSFRKHGAFIHLLAKVCVLSNTGFYQS